MNIVRNIDDNILGLGESRISELFFFCIFSSDDTKSKSDLDTTNELIVLTKSSMSLLLTPDQCK